MTGTVPGSTEFQSLRSSRSSYPIPLLFICGSLFLLPCDFPLRKCWQRPMLLWNMNDVTAITTVLIWVSLTAIFSCPLTFAVKSTHINDDWSSEQEGGSDSSNIKWHTHEKEHNSEAKWTKLSSSYDTVDRVILPPHTCFLICKIKILTVFAIWDHCKE